MKSCRKQSKLMIAHLLFIFIGVSPLIAVAEEGRFNLTKQIVIKENIDMMALPYMIAHLLVDVCYNPDFKQGEIHCPNQATFENAMSKAGDEEDYHAAISEVAAVDALIAYMEGRGFKDYSDDVLARHLFAARNSLQASAHARYQLIVDDRIAHYKSPVQVFARVIHGLFKLNLDETTADMVVISPQLTSILGQFRYEDNTPLFAAGLGRIAAANELHELGFHHDFLADQDEWLVNGSKVRWADHSASMVNLFFELDLIADVVNTPANQSLKKSRTIL